MLSAPDRNSPPDLRLIYPALSESAANTTPRRFRRQTGQTVPGNHPAMGERLERVRPSLDYDVEIRRVICSTNALESLSTRYRPAVRARGHFPTIPAALKCLNRTYEHAWSSCLVRRGQGRYRNVCPESSALQTASLTTCKVSPDETRVGAGVDFAGFLASVTCPPPLVPCRRRSPLPRGLGFFERTIGRAQKR